jgi:hypothetical protein
LRSFVYFGPNLYDLGKATILHGVGGALSFFMFVFIFFYASPCSALELHVCIVHMLGVSFFVAHHM